MVDQKEEAKKEKFIETMPTMIQTHLIMCKEWVTVKDTAKTLEHIIMKCHPPTPAMPMMATGATVLGLYSHIAHLVDKDKGEIPQPLKGTKPKQTRGRGKPKRKPQEQRQNPPKAQKADETYTYVITVKVVTDNLESSHNETEVKDLSIVNVSFKVITIREAHHNKIVPNMAIVINLIFRETIQMVIEAKAMAVDLSNPEDMVVAGPIIRITLEHISISITHMTQNQNNTVLSAVYVVDFS